ncbi:MAG TPA: AI-2E family transporter [Candidatus Microsaccharimonas sp.]|nr:AI-2E family transporter [Candidatus Microsaccharimonas sp.]
MFSLSSRNKTKEEIALTVTTPTFIRVLVLIIGTVTLLAAVHKAAHALVLIFIAVFLALALNSPVHWIADHIPGKKKGNRALATSISFLIVIILLGAFLSSLVPPLVRQTQTFINNAPKLVQSARSGNSGIGKFVQRYHLQDEVNKFSSQLSDRLKNVSGTALKSATHVGSSIFAMLTILAMTFMMLVEGPYWIGFSKRLIRKDLHEDYEQILADMYRVIKGYVNGQVTLAALAALLISPALFILGINYPVALIVIIFICGLIPMVGHTIGAIIVTTVALFHSPTAAIIILAYYILYQQIENYAIQPRIQANSTNLSPLLVFVSVVVGVSFNGLLGGLVAIPVMGCIRILALYWLEEHKLLSEAELEKVIAPAK